MTVTADQLRDSMVELAALEKRVAALCDPPLPFDRVVNFDPGVSATFVSPDQSMQNAVWVNGGPDFWCSGVGYDAWLTAAPFGAGGTVKLQDLGNGLGYTTTVGGDAWQLQAFDFRWNMTKLSSKTGRITSYLIAPGGLDSLLSRQALGNQETGRVLTFKPWRIERGDAVTFTIKPIGYAWSSAGSLTSSAYRCSVLMTMRGFRNQGSAK